MLYYIRYTHSIIYVYIITYIHIGDVLKIQSMLKICSEHLTENADHQSVAVLGSYTLLLCVLLYVYNLDLKREVRKSGICMCACIDRSYSLAVIIYIYTILDVILYSVYLLYIYYIYHIYTHLI